MAPAIFRDYDRAGLDAQYNLRAAVPNAVECLGECARRSGIVRATLNLKLDVPFGPSHGERLNLFPAPKPGAPVLAFIHGGYWQRLDKNDFDYIAEPFAAAGIAVVNFNYALAPSVTLDEILRQVRAAIAWTWREARSFNGDPGRIHIAGHSAGGHLAAMAALTDWPAFVPGLPANVVQSAMAISGVYDLEPIRLCYINDVLRLDEATARRNSPLGQVRKNMPPVTLAVGADETRDFLRQQREFAAALKQAGASVEALEVANRHHFDVILDLGDRATMLHRKLRQPLGE